jgi:hypothetical protein
VDQMFYPRSKCVLNDRKVVAVVRRWLGHQKC